MFTNTDLMFCYGQAQTALLPYDFLLFGVFGSNRRRHHNDLGVLPCNSCSEKLSVFLSSKVNWELPPKVLDDRG